MEEKVKQILAEITDWQCQTKELASGTILITLPEISASESRWIMDCFNRDGFHARRRARSLQEVEVKEIRND